MPAPRLIIEKEILENLINEGYTQKQMVEELHIARETLVKLLKENNLKIKEKPDELIGKRFGKLTIIDVAMRDNKQAYDMVCRCECGTICRKKYSQILKGEIVSCGCYAKEIASLKATTVLLNGRYSKKDWYFIKDNEKVMCRSGYEVIYANYLICNNIDFEYEPVTFKIDNRRRYTPDFYLKDEDRYVELKGMPYNIYNESNQREKIEILRKDYIIDIYYWEDIHDICGLSYKHYTYYKIKADRLGVRVEDFLGNMMYI